MWKVVKSYQPTTLLNIVCDVTLMCSMLALYRPQVDWIPSHIFVSFCSSPTWQDWKSQPSALRTWPTGIVHCQLVKDSLLLLCISGKCNFFNNIQMCQSSLSWCWSQWRHCCIIVALGVHTWKYLSNNFHVFNHV